MKSVVEICKDVPRSGTWIIAEGFDREHYDVVKLIKKHKKRFLRLDNKLNSDQFIISDNNSVLNGFIIRRVPAKKAGRPIDEILLNEQQAIFLGTLFRNTEAVLDFKERLARDFVQAKNVITNLIVQRHQPQWIENRAKGKVARLEETNEIKQFVKYCEKAGSKNADHYYQLLTTMTNKIMFEFNGSFKNLRDVMTSEQLGATSFHDTIVRRALREGMENEMEYHDIFKMVKARIMTLAGMYGKTEIISRQLALFEN